MAKFKSFIGFVQGELPPFLTLDWGMYEFRLKHGINGGMIGGYYLSEKRGVENVPECLIRTDEYSDLNELRDALENLSGIIPEITNPIPAFWNN
jgi:hypothetical protein